MINKWQLKKWNYLIRFGHTEALKKHKAAKISALHSAEIKPYMNSNSWYKQCPALAPPRPADLDPFPARPRRFLALPLPALWKKAFQPCYTYYTSLSDVFFSIQPEAELRKGGGLRHKKLYALLISSFFAEGQSLGTIQRAQH